MISEILAYVQGTLRAIPVFYDGNIHEKTLTQKTFLPIDIAADTTEENYEEIIKIFAQDS